MPVNGRNPHPNSNPDLNANIGFEAGGIVIMAATNYHNRLIQRPEVQPLTVTPTLSCRLQSQLDAHYSLQVTESISELIAAEVTAVALLMEDEDSEIWPAMKRWGEALAYNMEKEGFQSGAGEVGVRIVTAVTNALENNQELVKELLHVRLGLGLGL